MSPRLAQGHMVEILQIGGVALPGVLPGPGVGCVG